VLLSHGEVVDGELECIYHGWRFSPEGDCTHVPYLGEHQKLPTCTIRRYPVREQQGFIWVFPGDPERLAAEGMAPLDLPEWDHLNYIATVSIIDVEAHYSFLIENLMDMYHGRLHDDFQAWANPVLADLSESPGCVDVHYNAESYYRIDKIWSVSQLFFPALRQAPPRGSLRQLSLPQLGLNPGARFQNLLPVLPGEPHSHPRFFNSFHLPPSLSPSPQTAGGLPPLDQKQSVWGSTKDAGWVGGPGCTDARAGAAGLSQQPAAEGTGIESGESSPCSD
jgi:phenylpropionate dioxygenase-like ring-hydroxylating dioxygenase large terminal subunit